MNNINTSDKDTTKIKCELFDKELRKLISESIETINVRYKKSMELRGDIRHELYCINRYFEIYKKMNPMEHYCYFETIYNKHRINILNTLDDDSWLRNGDITIHFGEGMKSDPEIEAKRKNVKILLSAIYLIACDLQQMELMSRDGLDEKFAAATKDELRPNIILLHLMRIFYHLHDGKDKEELVNIVDKLETQLGVTKKTKQFLSQNDLSSAPTTGALSGIFNLATDMMKKLGVNAPENLKPPTETEISDVINKVFSNDATQNAIQNMLSSMKDTKDFGSAFQQVIKTVANPETIGNLQESIKQTTEIALHEAQQNKDNPIEKTDK